MKINKKTIIILIVVAVAVYLLWKKGVFTKSNTASSGSPGYERGTLDYILAKVTFTNAERSKINALKSAVDASATRREAMQEKAVRKGHTLDEQIVLDAIWLLYTTDGHWTEGPDGTTSYGWKLQQKVLNA